MGRRLAPCGMSVKRSFVRLVWACLTPVVAAAGAQGHEWHTVAPGGRTRCAFDTPFEFWVSQADPARIVVYLQGGGACWDLDSCDPDRRAAFDTWIDSTDYSQRRHGVFDRASAANPFRDQTFVFVPYCTGDLHLGTRIATYRATGDSTGGLTIHHAGYHNLRAVLAYLKSRPVSPTRVTVIGASAGSVASPVFAAELGALLPAADVKQIGDGGGAFRAPAIRTLLGRWGVDSLLASLGMPIPATGDPIVGVYRAAAARQPRIRFAQVSTSSDAVVAAWLRRVGDDPGRVSAYIDQTYTELRSAPLCFSGFVLPGAEHTIFWRPEFLTARIGGRSLAEAIDREVLRRPCPSETSQREARSLDRGDAAFLFAYRAKPDMDAAFAEGYRRHLDWHAQRGDSLSWLAWTVIDGPNLGTFVDGAFGIRFKAFDDRVDPRGDAEDGARNVTAFANPTSRGVYRLRRDLGTAARLEAGRPAAMQKVVRLTIRPESVRSIENALRPVASRRRGRGLGYAVYERVSGGDGPALMLIAQLAAWADLEDPDADPSRAVITGLGSAVVRVESEIWSYRPELTYFSK